MPEVPVIFLHVEPWLLIQSKVWGGIGVNTLEIRVPLFIKEGERVKVSTEMAEFAGRA